jgi:hypothetical protein
VWVCVVLHVLAVCTSISVCVSIVYYEHGMGLFIDTPFFSQGIQIKIQIFVFSRWRNVYTTSPKFFTKLLKFVNL